MFLRIYVNPESTWMSNYRVDIDMQFAGQIIKHTDIVAFGHAVPHSVLKGVLDCGRKFIHPSVAEEFFEMMKHVLEINPLTPASKNLVVEQGFSDKELGLHVYENSVFFVYRVNPMGDKLIEYPKGSSADKTPKAKKFKSFKEYKEEKYGSETSIKVAPSSQLMSLENQLPGLHDIVEYPCQCLAIHPAKGVVKNIIWHLNDEKKWPREQVADWLDMLHDSGKIDIDFKVPDTKGTS